VSSITLVILFNPESSVLESNSCWFAVLVPKDTAENLSCILFSVFHAIVICSTVHVIMIPISHFFSIWYIDSRVLLVLESTHYLKQYLNGLVVKGKT